MSCVAESGENQPEFFTSLIRKAKKEHVCGECKSVIKKGERYEYASGKWDGEIDSYKTCLSCVDVRDEVIRETGYYPYFGMVGCAYSEMINGEL